MADNPLSPHLQIYRPQLTSVLSIMHRATGVFLSLGTVILLYWLVAAALGANAYADAQRCIGSMPSQIVLAAWTFSFYFHLLNGVRHLFWDLGLGFELDITYRTGYAVVTSTQGAASVASLMTLVDGDVIISASRTDTAQAARQSWVPINTRPTTIRHGRVQHELNVANNNPVPASLRFILYGPDGREADRRELILPNEQQQDFTIAELFGRTQFSGTLLIASEPAVHISAEQRTQNLRDEPIAMQIPLITEPTGRVLPHFADGEGYATELFLVNTGAASAKGELTILAPDGSDLSLPLR